MPQQRQLPWYERPSEPPVVRELVQIREIGVEGLAHRKVNLPTVMEAAQQLAPNLDPSRQQELVVALFDFLFRDIGLIKGHHQRKAASELLGHADATYGKPEGTRRHYVADKLYHQAFDTFRRDDRGGKEPPLIRQVGAAIESILAAGRRAAISDGRSHETPYIERPLLEEAIRDLVNQGKKIIYVVGDAGTGKSRLARNVARKVAGEGGKLATIRGRRVGGTVQWTDDIARFLIEHNVEIRGRSDLDLRLEFIRCLRDPELAPRVLLIDGAEDASGEDWLMKLVAVRRTPESMRFAPGRSIESTVIVTSRRRPPTGVVGIVDVPNMSFEQAVQMIRSRLPGVSDGDSASLARALDCRPLAIEHSCAFLVEHNMPIEEFCVAVAVNTAEVLDSLGEVGEPTLTAIYRLIVRQVEEDRGATLLLDLVAHCPQSFVDTQIAHAAFMSRERGSRRAVKHNRRMRMAGVNSLDPQRTKDTTALVSAQIVMHKATATLRHLCLVEEDNDQLVMHRLTQGIVGDLRPEGWAVVCRCMLDTFSHPPSRQIDGRADRWAEFISLVLDDISRNHSVDEEDFGRLTLATAFTLRAFRAAKKPFTRELEELRFAIEEAIKRDAMGRSDAEAEAEQVVWYGNDEPPIRSGRTEWGYLHPHELVFMEESRRTPYAPNVDHDVVSSVIANLRRL